MIGFIMALAAAVAPTASVRPVVATTPALHGPAVVVPWASWCASCRAGIARLPRLPRLAVALDGQGRVCGRKLGLLGTDQLRERAARCSR